MIDLREARRKFNVAQNAFRNEVNMESEEINLALALCDEITWLRTIRFRAADIYHWYNLYGDTNRFKEHIEALGKILEKP